MTKLNLLALLASAALVACVPVEDTGDKSGSGDDDTNTGDSGSDSGDTDTSGGGGGGGAETGLAAVFFTGSIQAPGGVYASANFGQFFYAVQAEEIVCDFRGDLPLQDATPSVPNCPECDWAFNLGPMEGSTTFDGDCSRVGLADGAFDTYFDYDWGYSTSYVYTNEDGSVVVPFTKAVMLGFTAEDGTPTWFPFVFNASYNGNDITQISGDSSDLQFFRAVTDSSGQQSYAYYYL
jgi:hypothetical protein